MKTLTNAEYADMKEEIKNLRAQLAASKAREKRLNDALVGPGLAGYLARRKAHIDAAKGGAEG